MERDLLTIDINRFLNLTEKAKQLEHLEKHGIVVTRSYYKENNHFEYVLKADMAKELDEICSIMQKKLDEREKKLDEIYSIMQKKLNGRENLINQEVQDMFVDKIMSLNKREFMKLKKELEQKQKTMKLTR